MLLFTRSQDPPPSPNPCQPEKKYLERQQQQKSFSYDLIILDQHVSDMESLYMHHLVSDEFHQIENKLSECLWVLFICVQFIIVLCLI